MMARFKLGYDLWECSCGAVVAIGRRCWQCNRSYADVLQAQAKADQKPPKKRESKYREPAKEGTFIQSFLFRKKKS